MLQQIEMNFIFSKEILNLNNYERKMNLNSFLYYFGLSYPMFLDPNTSNIIQKIQEYLK